MKAEDTVMTQDDIGCLVSEIHYDRQNQSIASWNWECWREIAQAQAQKTLQACRGKLGKKAFLLDEE